MATDAADRLAQRHQRDIATIAGGVTSVVISTALGADPLAISTWYWGVVDGLITRIQVGYAQSRQSALQYLPRHAALSGAGPLQVVPGSLDVGRIRERLRIVGPVGFKSSIAAGADTDEAIRAMATRMAGVADEAVRDGDRDVVEQTALRGRGVVGWRRRLGAGACGWCAMLASRGAVYVSKQRATASKRGTRYHPHCRCWAEPLYRHEEEPRDVRLLQRQWERVTAGHSGDDAIRAWNRHWRSLATPRARQRMGLAAAEPSGGRAPAGTPVQVRQILADARSPQEVSRILADEYQRITGRPLVAVDLRGSVETAREHAEGILRAVERNPEIVLGRVMTGQTARRSAYAETVGQDIVFNQRWSTVAARQRYLEALAEDVRRGWHPSGTDSPVAVAVHEAGHVLDPHSLRRELNELLDRAARQTGVARERVIPAGVSGYAELGYDELVAEAYADVVMNGAQASGLSRAIVRLVDAAPDRGRGGVMVAPLPSLPDLSRLPVARLRAMVVDRGITVPPDLGKPQLVKLVSDLERGLAPQHARALAVQAVLDQRKVVADALAEAAEMAEKGASERALQWLGRSIRKGRPGVNPDAPEFAALLKQMGPLLDALDAADVAAVRAAIPRVAKSAKLRLVGGDAGQVLPYKREHMQFIGQSRGEIVHVIRPGWATQYDGELRVLLRADVQPATPEQVAAVRAAPAKVAKKAAPRKAAPAKATPPPGMPALRPRSEGADLTRQLEDVADLPRVEQFSAILRRQGFDRPATVTDARGIDAVVDDGGVELFRGSSAERARALAEGELSAAGDAMGAGAFGRGIYAGGREVAERYAAPDGLTRMALRPDAKVITMEDLKALREQMLPSWTDQQAAMFYDPGQFAAALGYDAIAYGAKGAPLIERNFVILNRSALVIERGPVRRAAELRKMTPRQLREYAEQRGIALPEGARKAEILEAITKPRRAAKTMAPPAKKAAPRKAAPKAPPAPERMTAPALRKELEPATHLPGSRLTDTDIAAVPKPVLAHWVRRWRELPEGERLAEIGRWSQVIIDRQRAVAEALAEASELLANEASAAALGSRAASRLRRIGSLIEGWPHEAQIRALVTAMRTGRPAAIRRAMANAEKKLGLRRIGDEAGATTRFNAKVHRPIEGERIADGAPVIVVRPGYEIQLGGERVVIMRPVVEVASGRDIGLPSRDVESLAELMARAPTDAQLDRAARTMTTEEYQAYLRQFSRPVVEGIEGTYAGLRVSVDTSLVTRDRVYARGTIYDAAGREVGSFSRTIGLERGKLVAQHTILEISRRWQGSGFAEAFNNNLIDWYRRSGVVRIELHADIDVGGYAWAAKGYDFRTSRDAAAFVDRAAEKVDRALRRIERGGKPPRGLTERQLRELADYIRDLNLGRRPISAPEIARFGRQPGQGGKAATWPGKWLMLGSEWMGVMPL